METNNIKSVYNFVPAPIEDDVFKPDWAEQVSHDIPFSDGESGEIELTITAKTPIFVRNGHSKKDAEEKNDNYLSFSYLERKPGDKQFFIPATSIKGMVRNVLEIISKSRLTQIDNHRHAVRQIMKTKGTVVDEGYDLKDKKNEIHAGWLIYKNGKHYIYDAGKPLKIRYTDLDNIGFYFENHFKENGLANLSENFSTRTAKYKYEKLGIDYNKIYQFEYHPLDENDKQSSWVSKFQPLNYVRFTNSNFESFLGHIVCVGQSMEYNNNVARKSEYVFKGDKKNILQNQNKRFLVSDNVFNDFLFINRHNKSDELEDWKYFKDKLNEGIPVFFRKEKKEKKVLDFGIPFMYKQPAEYSVKQLSPNNTYFIDTEKKDLAETIFGTTRKGTELKGRVYFSHMDCKSNINEKKLETKKVVLGSPRSSFFPFYLKQYGQNSKTVNYNTYNTKSELSGFKRYIVRNNINEITVPENANQDMITKFIPLPKETVFKGKIRYHNLKKAEIGALLSAITFHNQQENTFHSLGYSKPFGFGKVKLTINKTNITDYLKAFEYEILKKHKNWSISELLALAKETANENNTEYLQLSEFQTVKNEGLFLKPIQNFENNYRLISDDIFKQQKEEEKKRELQKQKEEDEKKRLAEEKRLRPYKELLKKADNLFNSKEWEEAKNVYLQAIELNNEEDYPKQQKNKCLKEIEKSNLGLNGLFDISNFNDGRKIIQTYFENKKEQTDEEKQIIKEFVFKCYNELTSNRAKSGYLKFKKDPWKILKGIFGIEIVQQWHNELNE